MDRQELALWLVDRRADRAARAVELAARLGAARLELPAHAWETPVQDRAREAGVEPLASDGAGVRSLASGEAVALPRAPEVQPWYEDPFRRACASEFAASVSEPPWVAGPSRLAPAASVEAHRGEIRMQLVGAWVGAARGIRLGPWPSWSELDPFQEDPNPIVEELARFRSAVRTLTQGEFRDEPVLLLEPDDPDDEDLRRIYECWLLLKLAGVRAHRVAASAAPRKVLNRAQLILIPGCWRLPEERWVNLGGWVRGGGTLYLGFDDRALTRGFEPGWGPPGPGFLERLTGRRPVGEAPFPVLEEGNLRLRFKKGEEGFESLAEIHLRDLAPLPVWPLADPEPGGKGRAHQKRGGGPRLVALGSGSEWALWRNDLEKGKVFASALPLEALLAARSGTFGDGTSGTSQRFRCCGPDLSRLFFALLRLVGVRDGGAPPEPFTDLAVATGRGGYPHGLVVVNRRAQRCPGRLSLELDGGFEASDLLLGKPVAFMQGKLVCPVDGWNYRVVGLAPKGR